MLNNLIKSVNKIIEEVINAEGDMINYWFYHPNSKAILELHRVVQK